MDTVRWGIIGCGSVTEIKSGPGFQKARGSELTAVMRRTASLAEDYARRHGVPRWYSDADDLINDPEVSAVYIATPPAFHEEYVRMAAAAGKPVYVEKPMGLTHEECLRMIRLCGEAGVPLFTAYYRRRLPHFIRVKELLETGAVGTVRNVAVSLLKPPRPSDLDPRSGDWHLDASVSGGGYFMDVGVHQLDILDWLFGPVEKVTGLAVNQAGWYKVEDSVSAAFSFSSGVTGTGQWCFTREEGLPEDRIVVNGTRGRLSFPTFEHAPILLETAEGKREFSEPWPEHIQQPLIQSVVDELRGIGTCPSTGESGARTNRVVDEICREFR